MKSLLSISHLNSPVEEVESMSIMNCLHELSLCGKSNKKACCKTTGQKHVFTDEFLHLQHRKTKHDFTTQFDKKQHSLRDSGWPCATQFKKEPVHFTCQWP